ncbi:transglycosylase SLT domain-containing protein [Myxococcota bacterium]|nr:transglycosylase SLT domain-containing protein [Myxococcota bacterium]
MLRIDTHTLAGRRLVVGVLVLLAGFLMSARTPEAPPQETGPDQLLRARVSVAKDAERVITSLNPSLSAHETARIGAAVERYSGTYSLDPDLVLGVILVESNARPWAHSPKGAVGLMQVMPYMMEPLGLAGNFATIESNIAAGCFILAHNIDRLGFEDGISAYFWGTDIRDRTYLEKVLEARQRVRRHRTS